MKQKAIVYNGPNPFSFFQIKDVNGIAPAFARPASDQNQHLSILHNDFVNGVVNDQRLFLTLWQRPGKGDKVRSILKGTTQETIFPKKIKRLNMFKFINLVGSKVWLGLG